MNAWVRRPLELVIGLYPVALMAFSAYPLMPFTVPTTAAAMWVTHRFFVAPLVVTRRVLLAVVVLLGTLLTVLFPVPEAPRWLAFAVQPPAAAALAALAMAALHAPGARALHVLYGMAASATSLFAIVSLYSGSTYPGRPFALVIASGALIFLLIDAQRPT